MTRDVLVVPLEEIQRQFDSNERQDVKIVASERLTDVNCDELQKSGKRLKFERPVAGDRWVHSLSNEPNLVCESSEFAREADSASVAGPFALSAGNERRGQDWHVHQRHGEIYFSTHPIRAEYRSIHDSQLRSVVLEHGGVLIFAPGVAHWVSLGGLTIIVEIPGVVGDKEVVEVSAGALAPLEICANSDEGGH
jgi:hypothetical protein